MNWKTICRSAAFTAFGTAGLLLLLAGCGRPEPGTFATPEEAIQAVASLVGAGDAQKTEAIFGPGSADLFGSGDPVADREDAERVKEMILTKVAFEDFDDRTKVALLGEKAWPLPIPLVRTADGKRWRFDTTAGEEELLNRRVGRNELSTLASLHVLVDAQREYRSVGRDGNPPAYAQKFRSSEGRRDGLYWAPEEGEPLSPLGDLFAEAEGYHEPGQPFHGYYFRMLTAQGANAPGGAQDYLDAQGRMTGGFAAIAWPAKHGNSGVMTFVVNQRGIVFQKDVGDETAATAEAIQAFDPDPTWEPTGDTLAIDDDEQEAAGDEAP